MRRSAITVLALVLVAAAIALFPALSLAAEAGSVSVSVSIGPCLRVSRGSEVRSNVSASILSDSTFLTVIAR